VISRIRGTVLARGLGRVEIMTAAGIGYEIEIPVTVYERLPHEGSDLELRTVQVVREDGVTLYGFLDEAERAVFSRLLTASGVGPRLALNMLSTLPPHRLLSAIADKDIATLRQIPGLGTKKAERLAVELGDRVTDLAVIAAGPKTGSRGAEEAVRALVTLGFSPTDAAAAVRDAIDAQPGLTGTEQMIRAALAVLSAK
jgi:holliday junction DNA helicase RuvA